MSNKIMIIYKSDYADEHDIHGLWFGTEEEWVEICLHASRASYPCEIYFGTNEYQEFYDYKGWLSEFDKIDITDDQYLFLCTSFNLLDKDSFIREWGHILVPGT